MTFNQFLKEQVMKKEKSKEDSFQDIRIAATRLCWQCDGKGTVEPFWREHKKYNEDVYPQWLADHPEPDDTDEAEKIVAWHREKIADRRAYWLKYGYKNGEIPPKQTPCHICNGTGRLNFELTYEQFVSVLWPDMMEHLEKKRNKTG